MEVVMQESQNRVPWLSPAIQPALASARLRFGVRRCFFNGAFGLSRPQAVSPTPSSLNRSQPGAFCSYGSAMQTEKRQ